MRIFWEFYSRTNFFFFSDSIVYNAKIQHNFKENEILDFDLVEEAEIDSLKLLNDLEPKMKTGDILLLAHEGLGSAIIKLVTRSQFSHASILVNSDEVGFSDQESTDSKHMVRFAARKIRYFF